MIKQMQPKMMSVICHLNFDNGPNHIYELRVRNIHSGKWYRLGSGTEEVIRDYCKHHHPDFSIDDNRVYNTLEELRP
jgi:hypothetical protein